MCDYTLKNIFKKEHYTYNQKNLYKKITILQIIESSKIIVLLDLIKYSSNNR